MSKTNINQQGENRPVDKQSIVKNLKSTKKRLKNLNVAIKLILDSR